MIKISVTNVKTRRERKMCCNWKNEKMDNCNVIFDRYKFTHPKVMMKMVVGRHIHSWWHAITIQGVVTSFSSLPNILYVKVLTF